MATYRKRTGKTGSSWQVQVRISGNSKSATFPSKREAVAWAREQEGLPPETIGSDSPENEIDLFTDISKTYLKNLTLKDIASPTGRLSHWDKCFKGLTIDQIEFDQINAALVSLSDGLTGSTVNRYRSTLSSVFSYWVSGQFTKQHHAALPKDEREQLIREHTSLIKQLHKSGWSNPFAQKGLVTTYRENPAKDYFLSKSQQEKLLTACKESKWEKMHLFVLMALHTGARKGELMNLTWSHLDLENRTAHLAETKNGKARYIPLTNAVITQLQKFKYQDKHELIFHSTTSKFTAFDLKKQWVWSLNKAGIPHCRVHDLRHTAASNLVQAGRSLFEVGTLLGHSSPQMTQRYSHLAVKDTLSMLDAVYEAAA